MVKRLEQHTGYPNVPPCTNKLGASPRNQMYPEESGDFFGGGTVKRSLAVDPPQAGPHGLTSQTVPPKPGCIRRNLSEERSP